MKPREHAELLLLAALWGGSFLFMRVAAGEFGPIALVALRTGVAALLLVPLAALARPATTPSTLAWGAALLLGLLCTGVAHVLYFRLIASAGAEQAMAVTYLIPLFGVFRGGLALGEPVTAAMGAGGAAILLGTALTTGLLSPRR